MAKLKNMIGVHIEAHIMKKELRHIVTTYVGSTSPESRKAERYGKRPN
jgi:hypothetical protein